MKMTVSQKQALNNDIILMRHLIRKVKVHLIHKLSRNVKSLKQKKGDGNVSEKFEKKAERLIEEIFTLKNFNNDHISKEILLETRNANIILSDINSTTENRVLAKVMTFNSVSEKIKEIREKYPATLINEFLKNLKNRNDNSKKVKNKKLKKNKKAQSNISTEHCETSLTNGKEIMEEDENPVLNQSQKNGDTEEDEKLILSESKKNKVEEKLLNKSRKKLKDENIVSKDKEEKKIKKQKKLKKIENDEEDVSIDEMKIHKKSKLKENSKPKIVEESVDPFFLMSNSQEEYLSIVKPTSNDETTKQQNRTYTDNLNRKQRRKLHQNGGRVEKKRFSDKSITNKSSFMNIGPINKFSKDVKPSNVRTHSITSEVQNLHPSWQAKLVQKPSVVKFEGKKIVFDES